MAMIGKSLGPYKIIEELGAGGMGEVYLAEDTRLKRQVAIKVLPAELAGDADRLARMRREAQLLATLNHPHVAGIYGFEEEAGTSFLALELVAGRGLDEILADGPLPSGEALELAAQITEGLEAAHEKGIIHRDLKPANIRITADDQAKVLDFGLAKGDPASGLRDISPDLSHSPTMAMPTMAGIILGTAAYMSPEQARAKPVDRRTDIWSFGCVLYEMLTGKQAFSGETVTDVMASVVKDEPDWGALPRDLPWRVRDLLGRCLKKDPRQRLRDIGDARLALRAALEEPAGAVPAGLAADGAETAGAPVSTPAAGGAGTRAPANALRTALPWALATLFAALALYALLTRGTDASTSDGRPGVTHLTVVAPPDHEVTQYSQIALSPDGRELVYRATSSDGSRLYRRRLDGPVPAPIPGTEGANTPFFSPDGRFLGFAAGGRIRLVSVDGGPPRDVCDTCDTPFGSTWGADGTIVFSRDWAEPLSHVPASGGQPRFLTTLDRARGDTTHVFPQFLPDGRVLFTIWSAQTTRGAIASVADGSVQVVHEGGLFYRYAPSGHLLYVRGDLLLAAPFDLATNDLGDSAPIADSLFRVSVDGFAAYEVSAGGVLAYRNGGDGLQDRVAWVDRAGAATPALAATGDYADPRLSPDGTRIVMAYGTPAGYQIAEIDLAGSGQRQLTREADNLTPVFSPDGTKIAYSSTLLGGYNLLITDAEGRSAPAALARSPNYLGADDWWGDGTRELLLFTRVDSGTDFNVWAVSPGDEGNAFPLAATSAAEQGAAMSPDGRWVAYMTGPRGGRRVHVVASQPGAAPILVTPDGGAEPAWNPRGGELFYVRESDDAMMSLPIESDEPLRFGAAVELFRNPNLVRESLTETGYDVAPDGQRFLMLISADPGPAGNQMHVILNAFELLERLAPTGR